ncbi:hypothetical protein LAZ40_09410 [Cereibacter sphaeroides]|uniref:hypothetical protein n=1 Tax=Cereibacter sphaeroides TaxID=1063 RepID=UPI001F3496A3|nr:hypothetical protein [Cereibacter sphaeroides]MCE6959269.1 hypothetical protein [Cereibacter sphaeroides]MCE6972861.1 hypothetical protein [Cereibacter sphaeroides]
MAEQEEDGFVRVPGTRIAWSGLGGWLEAVRAINAGPIRASAANYARAKALMGSLREEHLLDCRDAGAVRRFEEFMRAARYAGGTGLWLDPTRGVRREVLGRWIVLATNQGRWIAAGCPVREKGPRLDPSRIPDARLDWLIQRHPDVDLVERLRDERRRRQQDPEP